MMMSRPQPKTGKVAPVDQQQQQQTTRPKTSSEHVEDLERRLAMLGNVTTPPDEPPAATEQAKQKEDPPPPAFAVAAAEPKPSKALAGGKTALLARIMAAQEKAKTAAKKPEAAAEAAPVADLLDTDNAETAAAPPPPAFDETILPPPPTKAEEPPPPFDIVEQQQAATATNDPPPSFETLEQQPPAYQEMEDNNIAVAPPPAPMAPAYEDLLDHDAQQLQGIEPMQAPSSSAPGATTSMEDEIMGMEGLSEEERHALIEEQRQIMAQIEAEKQANAQAIANAQADAFDQRSAPAVARAASDTVPTHAVLPPGEAAAATSASSSSTRTVDLGGGQQVALHGQERTRAAIADGTAILVQCVHCQNWMQVTDTATLMFCPVCSVVSPVERQSAVLTKEEAMQMTADRRMAEQLQNEEYADEEEEPETWWDSVTSLFTTKAPAPATQPQPQQVAPTGRGDIGVALPPGAARQSQGLVAAQTGNETETITFSNSYEEREGLLLNNNEPGAGMERGRVAEQKPLFSCVMDSVSSAATSLGGALTTTTLQEDEEGNVHGVDSSSLLAVTRASRAGQQDDSTEYQPLNQGNGGN